MMLMFFIKLSITIIIIVFCLLCLLYSVTGISTVWKTQGDTTLTFKALLNSITSKPRKIFLLSKLIKEKPIISIEMNKIDNKNYIIISDSPITINASFLKGKQQYKIKIMNNNAELIDVNLNCSFPDPVFAQKLNDKENVVNVNFQSSFPQLEASVSGGGSVSLPGKRFTTNYDLSIVKMKANGFVELIITIDKEKSLKFYGPDCNYFVGNYSIKIGDEKVKYNVFYPIEIINNSYRLGNRSNEIPHLNEQHGTYF
jgi:hypothetical protein